jgi:hypothetical protein
MKYKRKTGILLLIALWSIAATGQVFERSRHESRTFRAYERTTLEVYNKYGNIHLFTWDKDSVKIEIDLEVKASKESKVDKMFEYIDFEFSDSKYYIIARTTFRQNQGGFWTELSDLANTMFSGGNKAQVDYNVYLPKGMSVKLENKFGNIYCTDHHGKFVVTLSNGDFKANNLTGPVELDLSFGNAGVNQLESAKIKGSYLDMDLASGVELFVDSKSSTYAIGKAGVIKLDSRRDKIYVDEVSSITGQTSFSYLTVKGFSKLIRLASDYGELKIKGIDPRFTGIDVTSKYTDIILQFGSEVHCAVDVEHSESTGIYFPDSYTGLKVDKAEEKGEVSRTHGFIGKQEQASGEVKISIQSGKVSLQEEIPLF